MIFSIVSYTIIYICKNVTLVVVLPCNTVPNVRLPEWSKGPGLGPGIFECVGSNPTANNRTLLFVSKHYNGMFGLTFCSVNSSTCWRIEVDHLKQYTNRKLYKI